MSKKITTYRIIAILAPLCLLVVAAIFTSLTKSKIKIQKTLAEEVLTKTASLDEVTSFNNFLTTQTIGLEKINLSLPSESMVVGVVQDIESITRVFDPNAKVQFSASTPVRIGQDLVVPMTISLTSPLTQIPSILDTIKQLPYIIQIISTESQVTADSAATIITLRLYVQEPFAGY